MLKKTSKTVGLNV